jgi:hypothetical protein
MTLINKTKNTVLAKKVLIANTPFKRIKGLLGKSDFKQEEALIIKPCNSIHTFFMRFAIDVIFVDKQNIIVKTISNLKPWRLTGVYLSANFCIELPAGTIASSRTSIGDCLSF